MNASIKELYDAEDFFHYFQVPYDAKLVMVTRLHILKRFRQYLERERLLEEDSQNPAIWEQQRALLYKAYNDFVHSTPLLSCSERKVPLKNCHQCMGVC